MPLDQQDFTLPETETKPTTRELPDKLSALILVALEDLEKAEASSRYNISMAIWHLPKQDRPCGVCLAGSVMAFSLGADPNEPCTPSDYSSRIEDKLCALNMVRSGQLSAALEYMEQGGRGRGRFPNERRVLYEISPDTFKAQLRDLAGRLARAGH